MSGAFKELKEIESAVLVSAVFPVKALLICPPRYMPNACYNIYAILNSKYVTQRSARLICTQLDCNSAHVLQRVLKCSSASDILADKLYQPAVRTQARWTLPCFKYQTKKIPQQTTTKEQSIFCPV